MTIIAPEKITITHQNGKTSFSAWGAFDTTENWRCDYVRSDIADRSQKSHNHEFAEIKELYDNLPEMFDGEPWAATADTFRKHALIQTGWCDVMQFFYPDKASADERAPEQKGILLKHHGYVVGSGAPVGGGGFLVVFKVPHSQSKAAMGAKAFQESKSAVLEWAEDLLKVDKDLRAAGA